MNSLKLGSPTVMLATSPVDFRKGIDGLCAYVMLGAHRVPSDVIYIFHNKGRDKVKLLFWHNNGYILLQKRLEKGKFTIPKGDKSLSINHQQLSWLLAGLNWEQMTNWQELTYDDYY